MPIYVRFGAEKLILEPSNEF